MQWKLVTRRSSILEAMPHQRELPSRGLIIKQPWIEMILEGSKSLEIRSSRTSKRGKVALIESGSSRIVGEIEITGCFEINREDFHAYQESHKVLDLDNVHYKRLYGWRLANPVRFAVPVRYCHPAGAIVWVDLTKTKTLCRR